MIERATQPEPVDVNRRHRRVGALFALATAPFRSDDLVAEAAEMIAILADALEKIATSTTDPRARAVAEHAMVEFHGP